MNATPDVAMTPCPSCGGMRTNTAKPGTPPLFACTRCGDIESPLVGVVKSEADPAGEDELAQPPPEDDLSPPPEEEEPHAAAAHPPVQQLMEILPADFPLPSLIKFAPDTRIRQAADADAVKLLELQVTDETSMRVVEACLDRQRQHKATIEALFKEPCAVANQLHKHLTGLRGDWLARTEQAIATGNDRVLQLQRRLAREEAEARRRAQEEADRQAREEARRAAEAAKKAEAPAAVVQELEFEAQHATAPPIQQTAVTPTLTRSTVVENWQPRLTATDRAAPELQPCMAQLSPAEQACVRTAMKAVLEGRNPLTIFEINWSVICKRAKADKKTFSLEGFVAEDLGAVRAKRGPRK